MTLNLMFLQLCINIKTMEHLDPVLVADLSTKIATFKSQLLEGIMEEIDDGREFHELYYDLYREIFVDFGKIGTVPLRMLGQNMRHMIDVVTDLQGDVPTFVRTLVEKQAAYIENQFIASYLIDCI
jgi:hypothetical protein